MNSYLWATAYSLLDILRYLLCVIVILGIPIYKKNISIPIWIIVSITLCLLCYSFFNPEGFFYLMPNICALLLIFIMEKKNKFICFLYIIVSWVIMDISYEIILHLVSILSSQKDYVIDVVSLQALLARIILLFVPFIYHIVVNICIRKKANYSLYPLQWVVLLISSIGVLIIVPSLDRIICGKPVGEREYLSMIISMFALLFLFISVMIWQSYVMRKNVSLKKKEIGYQYMLESQSKHFDDLIKNDNELRKFRHDMRAHITALREYANENHDEKILEYLSRMEEKANSTKAKRYTGNKTVDAVINDQVHQMEEKGIDFDFEGICGVREEIRDFDLCTVFYNLLKNAIEACEQVDSSKKRITVKVKCIGDKLGISIGNDTVLKEIPSDGILHTTKKDKINHGLGTRSVKEVVTRYDGVYANNIIDGRFVADVII